MKVGNWVVCVYDVGFQTHLTLGRYYLVVDVDNSKRKVTVITDRNATLTFYQETFKLNRDTKLKNILKEI
jgi:hypothetical protein